MIENNNKSNSLNVNLLQEKNDNKNGFFGTIAGFKELASEIKSITNNSLGKLFEERHVVDESNFIKLNVNYKKKNVDNATYKKESKKHNKLFLCVEGGFPKYAENATVKTVCVFLPIVLDKDIEQSIEECKKYNKLMWKKYSNFASNKNRFAEIEQIDSVFIKYKADFEDGSYKVENFKYQCEFYRALIDKFIEKHHLKPPEKKRAASIFFYVLMGLAIAYFCLCIFAPGLLIPFFTMFDISVTAATVVSYIVSPVIALICFKLARYISWKQNDYQEGANHELYSKYNEELKRHKIECVCLTGENCKIGDYEHNKDDKEAKNCSLYSYYHDAKGDLMKNTKTPLELLLELKKTYEIPKQFKNIESRAYDIKKKEVLN